MRTIHPVAVHEKFIASGTYLFYEHDTLLDQYEQWSIHELPDGSQFVRVDVESRLDEVPVYTLTETLLTGTGKVERCEIHEFRQDAGKLEKTRVNFAVYQGYLQRSFRIDQQPAVLEEITLADHTIIFPAPFVFWGLAIRAVYAATQPPADVYWLSRQPSATERQTWNAQQMGMETITLGSRDYQATRYQVESVSQQSHITCWLDPHHLLLSKNNTIKLSQYARRPEPKKS